MRDSFAVSVDAKQPTEVEIEIYVVSEEVPMDLGEPVSSEGTSGWNLLLRLLLTSVTLMRV